MATYNKFQGYIGYVFLAASNANTATYKAYLSNAVPSASADDVKTDLAEITNQNGYTAPVDMQNLASEATGTLTCTSTDITVSASGAVGPFQYVPHYDDTHASDILISWYDYGAALTLANGESFTIDYGASFFTAA